MSIADQAPAPHGTPPHQVAQAIRLTYAQMMLNAVFGASTGGMFLVGFALALGATDVWLGAIASVPQALVVLQLLAAFAIERGVSRKKLTVTFGFVTPLCWLVIAIIPLGAARLPSWVQLSLLVGVISLVSLAGQFVANARSSWIGDLIPAAQRGRFFGYCALAAGLVGAGFAVAEGRGLDFLKEHGTMAFAALFFVGVGFGLVAAALNLPQADCPLTGAAVGVPFFTRLRETFANQALRRVALTHACMALGGIAGPFGNAYMLRDVGLSYFQLGLLNAVNTIAALLAAPLWGRVVDRYGCRPILIFGLVLAAPLTSVWLFIPPGSVSHALWLLPWSNFIGGIGGGGVGVALSTLLYKVTPTAGRAVQFATYTIFVTLFAAPMPLVGGWLVNHLQAAGYHVDLRLTFYLWSATWLLAALVATGIREPTAITTRAMVFSVWPNRVARAWGEVTANGTLFGSLTRFELPWSKRPGDKDDPEA